MSGENLWTFDFREIEQIKNKLEIFNQQTDAVSIENVDWLQNHPRKRWATFVFFYEDLTDSL